MSVFGDFQDAWGKRFPGNELPHSWEDDVRGNLDAHRAKLKALREDVEKEEFYVDYLERLLLDVTKGENKKQEEVRNDTTNGNSEEGEAEPETNGDQYVTVINVSSYGEIQKPDDASTAETGADISSSACDSTTNDDIYTPVVVDSHLKPSANGSMKKKRPPTPPRKLKLCKASTLPSQQLDHAGNRDSLKKRAAFFESPSIETHSHRTSTPDVPSSTTYDQKALVEEEVAYAVKDVTGVLTMCSPSADTRCSESLADDSKSVDESDMKSSEDVRSCDINNESVGSSEAIYDMVAPDEAVIDRSLSMSSKLSDPLAFANYVNIDYFLRREETSSKQDSDDAETHLSRATSSDNDLDAIDSVDEECEDNDLTQSPNQSECIAVYDEVFNDKKLPIATVDHYEEIDELESPSNATSKKQLQMRQCILKNIIESEVMYVDCLYNLIQYKKALKSGIDTNRPLLTSAELDVIFYKIADLHAIHHTFLEGIKKLATSKHSEAPKSSGSLGDLFKSLASRLGAYSAYLKNYSRALETVSKCCAANSQFSEVTRAITLKSMKGHKATLEELLHTPVARVQKNALVLHDLLKCTKADETDEDSNALKTALKMTQCFLNELNIAATEQMFPVQDKLQRRLVKESFTIELVEGRRKLRHLFLFNDVIVCTKYKASAKQKFTFDPKWYLPLSDITVSINIPEPLSYKEKDKELSSEIMTLKSKVSSVRDVVHRERSKSHSKMLEKHRKKQSDMEGQLMLLLPQLKLAISHNKSGKSYMFYLSSEFDRTQWIESIHVLQHSLIRPTTDVSINLVELQAWIETCRKNLNPSLGSFLLRTHKDEDLLYGDLYLTIHHLKGISRSAELFFVIESDTYGHFFQRATTKTAPISNEPTYEQEFVLDLDGAQSLRFLCYECIPEHDRPLFRGKSNFELSCSWLQDVTKEKEISILDSKLSVSFKFVPSESCANRFPPRRVYGAFGVGIQTVVKKEKSQMPFLILGCIREVDRRGMKEVGIYRVSGLSSDVQRLKKAFETNPYEAEHLLKEIDIHAVTGLLKLYLRELPQALFTNDLYKKFFEGFSLTNQDEKKQRLIELFALLPAINQTTINFIIEHLANVNKFEAQNKMSLHNLATVFGPTLIRPGQSGSNSGTQGDQFTAGTIDVMAQAGILYFFLKKRATSTDL